MRDGEFKKESHLPGKPRMGCLEHLAEASVNLTPTSMYQVRSGTLSLNGTWSSPLIIEADARSCGVKTVMVVTLGCTGGRYSIGMYRRVRRAAEKVVAQKNLWHGKSLERS